MQLTRQARAAELRHEWFEVGATHAVDVELRALKRAQQLLFGALEEVQPLDRAIA